MKANIIPIPASKAPNSSSESPVAGLDTSTWTYRFNCDGRQYYLVKREKTRDGLWYLRAVIKGLHIRRSLDTHVVAVAKERAIDNHIRPARSGKSKQAVEKKMRSTYANLGTIEDTYTQISQGKISPLTLRNNINSFRLLVRRGLNNESLTVDAHRKLSGSVLTGTLVGEFEDWMGNDAIRTGRDLESNKRSVAGYLRFARSLFKATALPRYAELGVELPDMAPFLARPVEKAARVARMMPTDALVKRTSDGLATLLRDDAPVFIALLLAGCSMRRGEISKMRWDWMQTVEGQPTICIPKDCAKSGAARSLSIEPGVWDALLTFKAQRTIGRDLDEELFVIPSPRIGQAKAGARLRGQNVFKRANAWMRSMGWTTNHTLHELRALVLTKIANIHGDSVAQAVAGHSDVRTTIKSYIGSRPINAVVCKLPFDINPK